MKRRRLLVLGALAAGAIGAGVSYRVSLREHARAMRKRLLRAPVLDQNAPTSQPTEAELDTLAALAALILPSTAGESGRALARRHILQQSAQTPGMLVE